jgi:hypothetical protein
MAVLLALRVCGSGLAAEGSYTPKPGSPERRQIIGALREVVERELKKPVLFRIDALKVQDGWAFLRGVPLEKSGKPMDYRGTPFQESIVAGTFDDWAARCCTRKEIVGEWWRMLSVPRTCLSSTGRSVTKHRRGFSNRFPVADAVVLSEECHARSIP